MAALLLKKPKLIIGNWVPMGTNNMFALNRHVGAHKRYTAPTEFSLKGEVENLEHGAFKLAGHGCLLTPVAHKPSEYLKAKWHNLEDHQHVKGLEIDKDGNCLIGLHLDYALQLNHLKLLISEVEAAFTSEFLPVLTENQQELIACAYEQNNTNKLPERLAGYALIICDDIGQPINDIQQFMDAEGNKDLFALVTDWVTNFFTIENCHIFIGQRAMVCVGNPSDMVKELLKEIIIQKTQANLSTRMYSNLWSISKIIKNIGQEIPTSPYKKLKKLHLDLGLIADNFSKENLLNNLIKNAIHNKSIDWQDLIQSNPIITQLDTGEGFEVEKEKAEDSILLISQLKINIDSLSHQLQQRISLMMTINGQKLNLTLLILTLISVLSVETIFNFDIKRSVLVSFVLLPFLLFAIMSFIEYKKHFTDHSLWDYLKNLLRKTSSN